MMLNKKMLNKKMLRKENKDWVRSESDLSQILTKDID